MKEILFDTDILWKALTIILCLCTIVQGIRMNWLEKRIDKIQESFLEMYKSNMENNLKISQELTEAFKSLLPREDSRCL